MNRPLVLAAMLTVAACAAFADGSVDRGERLFVDYACYSCHGYHGAGRTPLDPQTSGMLSDEALFIRYLRLRGDEHPVNPSNSMPHYAEAVLSDEQARDLYAYLVTLGQELPAVDDIGVFRELIEDAERDTENPDDEH